MSRRSSCRTPIYDGSVIAYQKGLSTDFLTDLGFDIPAEIDAFATEGGQAYIPVEQLTVLDSADVLIWGTEADADKADLEQVPLFNSLTAVQAGKSIYTGGELAASDLLHHPAEPAVRPGHPGAAARRGAVSGPTGRGVEWPDEHC